jgi:glycosyltransferase involved in cell wall biosynthesis
MEAQEAKPRLLTVARDRYPPFRVDVVELFGRWLAPRFDLHWLMRAANGAHRLDGHAAGFEVSAPGLLAWIALQLRSAASVATGRADLVQVRDAALSGLLFLAAARIGATPFCFWMSFPIAEGYRRRALDQPRGRPALRLARLGYAAAGGWVLRRMVLPHADHVFAQSEAMKADLVADGVDPACVTAVPMGVSLAAYSVATIPRADDPRFEGRRVLAYLGSIEADRPIEVLVDMLGRLTGRFDAALVVVGAAEAADRARLEALAEARGVADRLIFTGHRPLAESLAYVRRADICLSPFPVSPPYRSATPTKLVEYLAMGRPVVASEHPDQRRVIEASGAGLVVPLDAGAFAEAAAALLADPERAEAMGARGPAWVAAFRDYAAISKTVAAIYDRLLERRP